MILLTTDTHLDDSPDNEYRWEVFDILHDAIRSENVYAIYHLGDLCDRKDRHSAALVNRLVKAIADLTFSAAVYILKGNHDQPMTGPPYFSFLNSIDGVRFIDEPMVTGEDCLMLPHSRNPKKDFMYGPSATAVCMHQTVRGALDGKMVLPGDDLPPLPTGVPIYSGDVHVPQNIGNVCYVGAPHPVRYGDSYPCRMLLLDNRFQIVKELPLKPIQKLILDISSVDELKRAKLKKGDQVRVRFTMPAGNIQQWSGVQQAIELATAKAGVELASIEPNFTMGATQAVYNLWADPRRVLEMFAATEGIEGDLLAAGLGLLEAGQETSR